MEVSAYEAKTRFSELLRRVAAGEEVLIRKGGTVVAKLVPAGASSPRRFGTDEGIFRVPDDFDAPLPDEVLATFES